MRILKANFHSKPGQFQWLRDWMLGHCVKGMGSFSFMSAKLLRTSVSAGMGTAGRKPPGLRKHIHQQVEWKVLSLKQGR